jgi:hypothetical protein
LNHAVAHGAKIANVSWVATSMTSQMQSAVAAAQAANVIVVAAAGNGGNNTDLSPFYPADLGASNVVSVAATDFSNNLAGFSSYGAHSVTLGAPGMDIVADAVGGGTPLFSGTSFAAPQVSSVLALVWSQHPSWSYSQVINQVLSTVQPLPSLQGKTITGGLLDAAAAVGANTTKTSGNALTVVSASLAGAAANTIDTAHVTFNVPVDPSSAVPVHTALLLPNGASIHPTSIQAVTGSNNTSFNLLFPVESMGGTYHLSVGPWFVAAGTGQPMPAVYSLSAQLNSAAALSVTSATMSGTAPNTIDSAQVTFNQPVDPSSAVPVHAGLLLPNGATIHPTSIVPVAGSNNTTFNLQFPVQSTAGTYQLTVGPWFVSAATGQPMAAVYSLSQKLTSTSSTAALSVLTATLTGTGAHTISAATVTFNQAVDLSSAVPVHVALVLPNGATIHPTSFTPIAGSNNTAFSLQFPLQSAPGTYQLIVGPWIVDAATQRPMAGSYTLTSTIPASSTAGIAAGEEAEEPVDLFFQSGSAI